MSARLRTTTARKISAGRSTAARSASTSAGSRYGETTSRIVPPRAARLATPRAASASPALEKYPAARRYSTALSRHGTKKSATRSSRPVR